MAQTVNFQKRILEELNLFFLPIKHFAGDPGYIFKFFEIMGWDMYSILGTGETSFVNKIGDIINSFSIIENAIATPPEDFEDFKDILEQVITIIQNVRDLESIAAGFNPPSDIGDLPQNTLEVLLLIYLESYHPIVFTIFEFIGVVYYVAPTDTIKSDIILRTKGQTARIDLSVIGQFLKNPVTYLKNKYLTSFATIQSTGQTGKLLFRQLERILMNFDIDVMVGRGYPAVPAVPVTNEQHTMEGMMTASFAFLINNLVTTFGASIGLLSIPEGGPGVFIVPFGSLGYNTEFKDWNISFSLDTSLNGFEITKNGVSFYESTTKKSISAKIVVDKSSDNDAPAILIGSMKGTHLQIGEVTFTGALDVVDKKYLADISVHLKDAAFVIKGGDGDGFLSKILPEDGIKIDFDLLVGYNNQRGLYFAGGAGLQVDIPVHKKLLGIDFESVTLSIFVKPDGTIPLAGAVTFNVDIGPLHLSVQNLGLKANLSFPANGGNLGPADLSLGFKSPNGIGLSINASAVKGGGFLNYDEATWTYTGGLELSFSKISFSAIGIVSTKLPGGKPGYSLLIIISAEFTPIQLGMGFTLNGIGGILGLNRTMNPDVLRNGIRDNTLDSILFPKDIVKNANTIISNIGQAFPAKEGQFLIGPMAKIGWGTPTLLTIELGIIIELPEPVRLAILGVVKALLPSKDNAIVKIQVNFLGIIDFTNKYLSFDASLYDSKILTFGLFGDMALRLYWGNKPNFLLSVGGFHPKFTPPPMNLPELRRLTIVLANQDNLKISVETYFAITSNSVQFGAKVAAMAKAWKIQAIGALWFDILFQFKPFYFIADMGVMFAIKMGSKTILSLYVNLTLEGPNPWRARGKGSFKVLFVKVSVSFDKTFGQARVEAIQAEAIDGRVKAALTNRDNWEALLPARSHELISWREEDISNPATEISVDPAGSLKINQRLIPLQTTMSKFGSSAISDYKRYDITSVKAGTDTLPKQTIQDNFARNEFFYMTDDEKLSRSSYELFDSGVIVGSDKIDSQYAVHSACHYEEITLDAGYRRPEPIYALSANLFGLHRFGNYISRSGLSDFDRITTSVGPNRVKVDLQKEEFVLIDRNNMNEVSGYFSNSAAAQQYLTAQQAGSPATAGNWIVANRFEL